MSVDCLWSAAVWALLIYTQILLARRVIFYLFESNRVDHKRYKISRVRLNYLLPPPARCTYSSCSVCVYVGTGEKQCAWKTLKGQNPLCVVYAACTARVMFNVNSRTTEKKTFRGDDVSVIRRFYYYFLRFLNIFYLCLYIFFYIKTLNRWCINKFSTYIYIYIY